MIKVVKKANLPLYKENKNIRLEEKLVFKNFNFFLYFIFWLNEINFVSKEFIIYITYIVKG